MDAVIYLKNIAACKRYLLLEMDNGEHARRELIEDVFKVNWMANARFRGKKVYVVRLNPDSYQLSDGEVTSEPSFAARLQRLARVVRCVYDQTNTDARHIRVFYLYYSPDRLQVFLHRSGCRLSTVEADVEYSLVYQAHEDPGYLAYRERLLGA